MRLCFWWQNWKKYLWCQVHKNGLLLHCMHKQQDIFGCLAKILGCLGLREAANLEIWPLRPRRGQKGQSSKVGSLEKALGQPKIEARPPKRSRCICIQYNRRFCCIFAQRLKVSFHQILNRSIGRACGSHTTVQGSIFGICSFWQVQDLIMFHQNSFVRHPISCYSLWN